LSNEERKEKDNKIHPDHGEELCAPENIEIPTPWLHELLFVVGLC
jgi:hypothetical protein